jgi:hypothetical protein
MTIRSIFLCCTVAFVASASVAEPLKDIDSKTLCEMYLAKGEPTYLDSGIEQELRNRPAPAPVCTLPSFMQLVITGAVTIDSLFDRN